MRRFGQVIETYPYDKKRWLTIWDLERAEQVAVMDRAEPNLKIGQLVTFERTDISGHIGTIKDVQKIGRRQLPAHLKPLI